VDAYTAKLEALLYEALVELEYAQCCIENPAFCASGKGREIVKTGMELPRLQDLSGESWRTALRKAAHK
jgi:hypothetical protein